MPNEIRPHTSPTIDSSMNRAESDQARRSQDLQKTQEMQEAQFKKSAMEALQKTPETPRLAEDFLGLIESVVQEAYESSKTPVAGKAEAESGNLPGKQNSGQASPKDLQMLREFMREATYLIRSQNMEVTQMLNTLKVQQGGVFWNKLQEVLQKGIPVSQAVLFQNVDKNLSEMSQQFMGMEALAKATQGFAQEKSGLAQPGRAILEIVQAESNPQGALEHYQSALQLLMKDQFQVSAQKLMLYLRKRSGFGEHFQEAHLWANELRKDIVAPQPQKMGKFSGHWLSLLLGILSFALLIGLGQDWIASLMVGVSLALVIFLFGLILKK